MPPRMEDKILLCKRAIELRHGLWTLPAGFMENEMLVQAASINMGRGLRKNR
ncbi:MAG: hypothetical protein R3E08_01625 [Thiotrichaceae bacterium]